MIKDEGRLPTGSFKARGLALAVAMAKELGVERMAMPTNGNAGAALAAYCSRAGIETFVFCPDDTPKVNVDEISFLGAKTFLANGFINDCGRVVGEGKVQMNWFDTNTQGALQNRGEKDDGVRASRAAQLENARCNYISNWRRNRANRDVESV